MKRWAAAIVLSAVAMSQGVIARADDIASLVTPNGVDVQVHLEGQDSLVITILPTMDVKLNGQLGIGIRALYDDEGWQRELPSLLVVEGDYFDGAVLQRFPFDAGAVETPSTLGITFGACLPASGVCILEETEVTLVRETNGSLGLTLATLKP